VMKLTAGLAEVNRGEVGQRLPPIRRKKWQTVSMKALKHF
jgi:hypothetical protein